MIQDAQKEWDPGDKDALQAANIGQNIQDRVAVSLYHNLVQAHFNHDPKKQVVKYLLIERSHFCLFQSEGTWVLKLGYLIEVDGQILKGKLSLAHLEKHTAPPIKI